MDIDGWKRLIVTVLTLLALFLHNKFGIDLSAADIAGIAGVLATFLAQSGLKSIVKAKVIPAATDTAAAASLSK